MSVRATDPVPTGSRVVLESVAQDQVAQADLVDLGTALRSLLQRHPQLRAAEAEVVAAESNRSAAWRGFLPEVVVDGDAGYERVSTPSSRALPEGVGTEQRDRLAVTVTQNLFDGFGRLSNLRQAQVGVGISQSGLETTRQSLLLEGAAAFYDVIRQAQLVQLAVENERRIQEVFDLEDERVQRGAGIAVDVLQAKARLQLALERRVAFEGALREAAARYRQVFDVSPDIALLVEPQLPPDLLPGDLDAARVAARDGNPVLEGARQQARLAVQERRAARSGYYPRIDIVAETNWQENVDGLLGNRRDRSVLLVASWNFTAGFVAAARTREATARIAAAENSRLQTSRKLDEEVELAWQALETARRRSVLLANAVTIAAEVYTARQALRDAGRETTLNVLDAESELYSARISEVSALFDARLGELRLLAAMGEMERLIAAVP